MKQPPPNPIVTPHPIILFDGVCNLCNGAVDFIMRRDQGTFRFASLQSSVGQQLANAAGVDPHSGRTLVLLDRGEAFVRSDAALRIARRLPGWRLLYGLRILPRFLRDPVYDFIARHRYRFFGRRPTCRIPSPTERARFIAE